MTWRRVETEAAFRAAFADRVLEGDGIVFTIHGDGRMTGQVDGATLSGRWVWREGMFCRTATLDGTDLGTDCEVIEADGGRMRYIRDGGRGAASVVTVRAAG